MCSRHNCLVIVTTSAIDCDVISKTYPSEWDTETMFEDRSFDRYLWIRYVVQEVQKRVYSRDELFMRPRECQFGVYFPRCFATRQINTKITLSWALKQFATRVHTLSYIDAMYKHGMGK